MEFAWDTKKAASNLAKHDFLSRKLQPYLAIRYRIPFPTQIILSKSSVSLSLGRLSKVESS